MRVVERRLAWAGALFLCTAVSGIARSQVFGNGQGVKKIVVFDSKTDWSVREMEVKQSGCNVRKRLEILEALAVICPETQIEQAVTLLKRSKDVVRVDEDVKVFVIGELSMGDFVLPSISAFKQHLVPYTLPRMVPSRPNKLQEEGQGIRLERQNPEPEGQKIPWGIARLNAPRAWEKSRGAKVRVGIIDTGVDPDHPDLKGNVAGGYNAIDPKQPWKDDHGHGTHVSGTVAALDNDIGVVGVAPKARIYSIKVLDSGGSGTWSDVADGIGWAIKNKMQVISMSLGASSGNDSVKETVSKAYKAGITIVAAAGNDYGGPVGYPAAYEECIAVSAGNDKDQIADFSSVGPEVDFIAPGENIRSTTQGDYAEWSGTSMATPHVTGLVALKLALKPSLKPSEVRQALKGAAFPIGTPSLPPEQQGAGLVDAAKLVGVSH